MSGHDKQPPPTVSLAVSQVAERFWAERAKGRVVSVDELLDTTSAISDRASFRVSVIQKIASDAATYSGDQHQLSSSIAHALSGAGPLPRIDGYDLVACLGRGGMGAVYEGYQQSTGRRVAVKFMLDSIGASNSARKRFEREVEVVARLQHPSIVSIIDSGVRRGRYYYAMDFVEGWPLDASLLPGKCEVRKAVELVAVVCDAVDYAHQRGVLHRDLKPGNIIVDDNDTPHLLDFGLAKVFDPDTSDGGNHGKHGLTVSGPGQLLGTVAYMSPEQAEGRHDETSVRTDVYALGAILYELLTGELPASTSGSLHDVLERIKFIDPAPPSSKRPKISRDLDAVVLKSLEKSPDRRYSSAGEFAADLRRYVAGEPVVARRVSAAGRAWRLMQRNRAVSTVTAAGVLAVTITAGVLFSQVIEERNLAQENFDRLRGVLLSADPDRVQGGAVTVLQMLDKAMENLDQSPPDRDRAEVEMREVLGSVYRTLGEYGKSLHNLERALAIRERHAPRRGDQPLAKVLHNYAAALWWDGRYDEAEEHYTRSLEISRRLHAGDHENIAGTLTHLAACRLRTGNAAEARAMYEEVLQMRRRMYTGEHERIAQALNNLGKCLLEIGEFRRAELLHQQSLDMIRRLRGDSHTGTASASQNLGDCLLRRGEADAINGDLQAARQAAEAAKEAFSLALEIRTAAFPSGHHHVAASLDGLARAELWLGNIAAAEELANRSIAEFSRTSRRNHPDMAGALTTLGRVTLANGDPLNALEYLGEALAIAKEARPTVDVQVAILRGEFGWALAHVSDLPNNEHSQAHELLRRSLAELQQLRGENSLDAVQAKLRLARYHEMRGEDDLAEPYRRTATLERQ